MDVRVLWRNSLYASMETVRRSRRIVSSVQQRLNGWSASLEFLELENLHFRENRSLRSITLCAPFPDFSGLAVSSLWTSISTITSLAFCEFVLGLGGTPFGPSQSSLNLWGNWDETDKLLLFFLDRHPDFTLVIKTDSLLNSDRFKAQVREGFPSMAGRDRIRFETFLADEYRCKCSPRSVSTILRIRN